MQLFKDLIPREHIFWIRLVGFQAAIKFRLLFLGQCHGRWVFSDAVPDSFNDFQPFSNWK